MIHTQITGFHQPALFECGLIFVQIIQKLVIFYNLAEIILRIYGFLRSYTL